MSIRGRPLPITHAYLLVTHIPYFVDDEGAVWLERLWHRDFVRHLAYLQRLTVAAPQYRSAHAAGYDLVRVEILPNSNVRFVPLPKQESVGRSLKNLPRTAAVLWKSISTADLVHSGVVGWPFPIGWIANAIAIMRRKPLIIVVESTPWRLVGGQGEGGRGPLWAAFSEALARWSVNHASVRIFTQASYQQSLFTGGKGPSFVMPASWVNEDDVLDGDVARELWQRKRQASRVRMLFAGRLTSQKGVEILLEAIGILSDHGVALDIDIAGEGPLKPRCHAVSQEHAEPRVRILDPVAYGADFFELIRQYNVVLVPSLSDEQPRIVFDAFSQAVPVIAANTDGLRPHVVPDVNGWLVTRSDARALAAVIVEAVASPEMLERFGLAAVQRARLLTHGQMHFERWQRLVELFGAGSREANPPPKAGAAPLGHASKSE